MNKDNINKICANIIDNVKNEFINILTTMQEKIDELSITNEKNNIELNEINNKNNELLEKIKSKSSSSLWESMQSQLQEKDIIIEQLKKDLEFYKRQYLIKNNKNEDNIQNAKTDTIEITKKKKKDIKKKKKTIQVYDDNKNLDDLEKELMN